MQVIFLKKTVGKKIEGKKIRVEIELRFSFTPDYFGRIFFDF